MMTSFTLNDLFAILTLFAGFAGIGNAIIASTFLNRTSSITGLSFGGFSAGLLSKTSKMVGKGAKSTQKIIRRGEKAGNALSNEDAEGLSGQLVSGSVQLPLAVTNLLVYAGSIFLWANSGMMLATTSFGIATLATNNVGFTNNGYSLGNGTHPSAELDPVYVIAWIAMFANGIAILTYVLSTFGGRILYGVAEVEKGGAP